MRRLLAVLDREEVAAIRTLEMKISDGGPLSQRVEPHVLGIAGLEQVERGRITIHKHPHTQAHNWYAPSRFRPEQIAEKLDKLAADYLATTESTFTSALGDPLEISVFKALLDLRQQDRRVTFLGSFDLSAGRQANGRFRKTEPPVNLNDATLDGPPDFVLIHPANGEPALIECKNYREWIYPSSAEMKTLVRKALAADMTPILVARRLPFITKAVLCAPAGIVAHETYNQLYPETPEGRALADVVTEKRGLGYFDVKASEAPLPRTLQFFHNDVPTLLPRAAKRFQSNRAILQDWVDGIITWRVLYQHLGSKYSGPDGTMEF